jgi:tellurite resistance protein
VVFKYIALADRRLKDEEKLFIRNAIKAMSPNDVVANGMWSELEDLRVTDELTETHAAQLATQLDEDARAKVLTAASKLAESDGKQTPKEKEKLARLRAWLR